MKGREARLRRRCDDPAAMTALEAIRAVFAAWEAGDADALGAAVH